MEDLIISLLEKIVKENLIDFLIQKLKTSK